MKGINTSIFDFPTLRDPVSNYVYVDKTAQLYEIANGARIPSSIYKHQYRGACIILR